MVLTAGDIAPAHAEMTVVEKAFLVPERFDRQPYNLFGLKISDKSHELFRQVIEGLNAPVQRAKLSSKCGKRMLLAVGCTVQIEDQPKQPVIQYEIVRNPNSLLVALSNVPPYHQPSAQVGSEYTQPQLELAESLIDDFMLSLASEQA